MKHHAQDRAPDYTNAALIMLGINLFCLLYALWLAFGLVVPLITAFATDRLITRLGRRR
ncbi:hypothetical protein R3X27_17650 [Tropicimonas sp. TH_r6]|uniref:hypothetical protein n=1 Tax=Tropicimonas sp. TH_r6 TaxID=3082085 RepID=UPI0029537BC6|nr:hypothetical protein [Tropicimonas sp. TH_r6]MDV7144506.1 hypothetical protein [Tropicimonas sp. TH_r6]